MIKVVLADDHPVVRQGTKSMLSGESDIYVVGEVASGDQLMEVVNSCQRDVVVLDVRMPGHNVVASVKALKESHPAPKVLILSGFDNMEYVLSTVEAGVSGYLLRDEDPRTLLAAMQAVAKGQTWLSAQLSQKVVSARLLRSTLSEREIEVLALIGQGFNTQQIAKELYLSPRTIQNRVFSIYKKLNLKSRAEAARYAMEKGLLPSQAYRPADPQLSCHV